MIHSLRTILYGSVIGAALLFISCSDNDKFPDEVETSGQTIMVPNDINEKVNFEIDLKGNWTILNENTWFNVSSSSGCTSGEAGTNVFTVEVLELNTEMSERVASFVINDGTYIECNVVQDPVPGWNIPKKNIYVSMDAQLYSLSFEGNMDFDIDVDNGSDWISVENVTKRDSVLLDGGRTYSKYMTYVVNMSISASDSEEPRSCRMVINGVDGITKDTVTITQTDELMDIDWNRKFYRRSFLAKFSATWCSPCYSASNCIHEAMEKIPGRIELAQFMLSTSFGQLSEWGGSDDYYFYYVDEGYFGGYVPALNWNNYIILESVVESDAYVMFSNEAENNLPAQTAVAGSAEIVSGNVEVSLTIASKIEDDYLLSIFLLEDSLYTNCVEGTDYPNNDIVREEFTEMFGDPVSVAENDVINVTYSKAIPSYVQNQDNLHVMVVVYRKGTFRSSLWNGRCNFDTVVDNVVDIPVNASVKFEYED